MNSNFRYVVCRNDDGTELGVGTTPKGTNLEHVSRAELYKRVKSLPGAYHTALEGKVGSTITIVEGALVAKHVRTSPNAVKQDNLGELPTFEEFAALSFLEGIK